ncbi:hypothetical protein OROGR_002034 [Orobanche gracilis]
MASAAATPKANPYSLSHTNLLRLNSSSIFRVKITLFSDPRSPRLIAVQSQNPDLDSIKMDQTVSGFGSGSGSSDQFRASSSSSAVIDFLTLCHRLKSTKRKGWINHGIMGPESIADHMYRMSLMALIADDLPGVNRERCIKIAIVHDLAEAIVGDITPSDGVPKEEKSRMEQEALDEMCKVLGGGMRAEEIKELWQEYENNSSLEANLVKDFDKVEMILQALEYETGSMEKSWMNFFCRLQVKFKQTSGKNGQQKSLPGEIQD